MLAWLCVWVKVQICIWPSWCHCHSLSLAPVNPDWFCLPSFTFLVPAHLGSPRQSLGGRKMIVVVVVLVVVVVRTRSSAGAEIVRHANCLFHSLHLLWGHSHRILGSGSASACRQPRHQPPYPVMCRLPSFVALCDHNPPTLQTDRQTDGWTDGRHARSISTTCKYRMSANNRILDTIKILSHIHAGDDWRLLVCFVCVCVSVL